MTKYLIVIGVIVVIMSGGLAELSGTGASAGSSSRAEETQTAPAAEATSTPEPTAEAVTNRADCGEIRGTDYLSADERTWFLANCVRN
jgi:hypothetical protein